MNHRRAFNPVCYGLIALACSWTGPATSAEPGQAPPVSRQAERSFQQLQQIEQGGKTQEQTGARATVTESTGHYDSDQYLIGKGQGDLNKGRMVCQRVSELSARTDLAKQIRVMVKEHMVDRIRERTGREAEQDIELTREEIVQEYLQGVKIVDRQVDEEKKICTATAVMLKSQIQPKSAAEHQESTPTAVR